MIKKLLILLLVLIPVSVGATDYYYDPDAAGANNGTSQVNAWETYGAIGNLSPGDTLYFCGTTTGASSFTITEDGTSGNYITYDGNCPGDPGIIQNATDHGIDLEGASWVIVQNFTINQSAGRGISGNNSDNIIIRYNTVTTLDNSSYQSDGIGCFSSGGNGCDTVLIEGNKLILTDQSSGHNDCVQGNQGTDWTIKNNYCSNIKDSEGYSNAQGLYTTQMYGDVKMEGNVVYLKQGAQAVANRNLDIGTSQTYMINNTIKCGSYRCIYVTEESDPVIKNNIVWQYRVAAGLFAIQVVDWSGTASNIDGNLCYNQNGTSDVNSRNGQARTWAEWQAAGYDAHGYNTDPSLDSDYKPDSGDDPSVGTGQVLAAEYDDGLSTDMTIATWISAYATVDRDSAGGSTWDIGAFEYSTEESPAGNIQGVSIH